VPQIDRTHILVLNYNGRRWLAECLPSVLDAARVAPLPCRVTVIDNASTDDSLAYLAEHWPDVEVAREPNRGLASFNAVLARCDEPVVLLLNNDIKLDHDAVGPLIAAMETRDDALFAAPQCWTFDGATYEGMRTRVRTRYGLVQGLSRVPGFEREVDRPGGTASAGPVLAVHRERFLALGGYDPVYFPGRIEDLDLGFRGWMRGWRGYYVPQSRSWHHGFGSFGPEHGPAGCDRLAARNTLLFSWKNLAGPRLWGHLGWLPPRLAHAAIRGRVAFLTGFAGALPRLPEVMASRRRQGVGGARWIARQEEFFSQYGW
jgi:GT2 family glycosyltransferase